MQSSGWRRRSRPDLAVQVSLSQQALSDPRVRRCRQANAMVRRAKQHHELDVALSSNTVGKLAFGDAFGRGFFRTLKGERHKLVTSSR